MTKKSKRDKVAKAYKELRAAQQEFNWADIRGSDAKLERAKKRLRNAQEKMIEAYK